MMWAVPVFEVGAAVMVGVTLVLLALRLLEDV